jgi:hypothetical protein
LQQEKKGRYNSNIYSCFDFASMIHFTKIRFCLYGLQWEYLGMPGSYPNQPINPHFPDKIRIKI